MVVTRARFLVVAAVVAAAALAPSGAGAAERPVGVYNTFFEPQVVTLAQPGDTIAWEWLNGTHTVTAYSGATFDSNQHPSPSTFQETFPGGLLKYRCKIHSTLSSSGECAGMCGFVTEQDSYDTQRPSVAITTPAFPYIVVAEMLTMVTIAGYAADNVAVTGVGLRVYDIKNDVRQVPLPTCPGCGQPGTVSWSTRMSLLPGRYVAEAVAADQNGNTRVSERVTFHVV